MNDFNMYLAMTFMSIVLLLVLALPASAQQMQCGPNNGNLQAQLVDRYGETIIEQQDVPNGRAELWANDETGSFTVLFFPAGQSEAVVCIVGSGTDPSLIDQSEPA